MLVVGIFKQKLHKSCINLGYFVKMTKQQEQIVVKASP